MNELVTLEMGKKLKSYDFILESKMVKVYQNKISKQPD